MNLKSDPIRSDPIRSHQNKFGIIRIHIRKDYCEGLLGKYTIQVQILLIVIIMMIIIIMNKFFSSQIIKQFVEQEERGGGGGIIGLSNWKVKKAPSK